MFKQLVEVTRQALFLLRDAEQNKQDIATLKEQLAETNKAVLNSPTNFSTVASTSSTNARN